MVSVIHEAVVELFRNRPELAVEALTDLLGVPVASQGVPQSYDSDLSETLPPEYRADLALILDEMGIIVEVQRNPDERKRFSWPAYQAVFRARLQRPAVVLVVCLTESIARWSSEPIEMGQPGLIFRPLVLGPAQIPVVRSEEAARTTPELGVLSAMVHGQGEHGEEIGRAVVPVLGGLDAERSRLYLDLVLFSLSEAARAALEAIMIQGYEYQSDFARRYFSQGRQAGVEIGQRQGQCAVLIRLAEQRFGAMPAESRVRVEAADAQTVDRWLDRLLTASSLDELLDG